MDLWIIEKCLCGPLRFVFEHPWHISIQYISHVLFDLHLSPETCTKYESNIHLIPETSEEEKFTHKSNPSVKVLKHFFLCDIFTLTLAQLLETFYNTVRLKFCFMIILPWSAWHARLTAQVGEIRRLRGSATGVSFAFSLCLCRAFVTWMPQQPWQLCSSEKRSN